ncbi:MAG: hypothetical protein LKM32_09360 [Chiayiivirga sp.]|jgi:hypothetical protein|uniref:hypothetical protein n=1 Tax=Chiayiivirga sp. TaxID=2041042 RepID=UPI0025BB28F8|nr:hypothetical protein [Chiayiivirga sp.]MCI1711849.1 hypothetical protein [Chiayiivirga sp.]MCI1729562.1 hypothetical protein [Chiayiivirga sp.]
MGNEAVKIKTDEALLKELRSAPRPTSQDVREQRISFAVGALDEGNAMTRKQVREIIERKD